MTEPSRELSDRGRLLVVDDFDINRAILSLHLTHCGYTVVEARDGAEALTLVEEQSFDLILLDLQMPKMDGMEVLAAIRRSHSRLELPIIVVSARDGSSDMVKAFEFGANDYIQKPIDIAVTEARIQAHMNKESAPPPSERELPTEDLSAPPVFKPENSQILPPGTVLGNYTIKGVLGRGGMGVVYEAVNEILERRAALKLLPLLDFGMEDAVERFRREARTAAKIEHPNVVGIYDVGKWEGRDFIAMQLVDGGNAYQKVATQGPLPWAEALAIVRDVCKGLGAAHDAGIVHRDIKPGNLLFSREGEVKLADFGLAKPQRPAHSDQITVGDRTFGTPQFMSPEQFREGEVGPQADVYALGTTLFMLLTGRTPFQEEEGMMAVAVAQVNKNPPDVRNFAPNVPKNLATLIAQTLEKDPLERPKDANQLLEKIEALSSLP